MTKPVQLQSGFTLLELLVANLVFLIVFFMGYAGLSSIQGSDQKLKISQQRLTEIQLSFLHFERDLQHIAKRPIRSGIGEFVGELVGDELNSYRLVLTRGGLQVPKDIPKSTLQRVAYLLEDETLYRLTWPVLDQAQDTEPRKQEILTEVENVELRFLSPKGEWQASWDSHNTTPVDNQNAKAVGLPRAAAVKLTIKGYGQVNRLFLLSEV